MHTAELQAGAHRVGSYGAANRTVRTELLPLARKAVGAALAAYRAGQARTCGSRLMLSRKRSNRGSSARRSTNERGRGLGVPCCISRHNRTTHRCRRHDTESRGHRGPGGASRRHRAGYLFGSIGAHQEPSLRPPARAAVAGLGGARASARCSTGMTRWCPAAEIRQAGQVAFHGHGAGTGLCRRRMTPGTGRSSDLERLAEPRASASGLSSGPGGATRLHGDRQRRL